jgi:hypothetical protein
MSRFNMLSREGHLKAVKRILSYLTTFQVRRHIVDVIKPNNSLYSIDYHSNWIEFYPDTGEKIPEDLPTKKDPRLRMTVYVMADHAHDLVTKNQS